MDERVKKAFDFASDSTKQLITLSTAILALTITFNKDVLHNVSAGTRIILTCAWFVYLLSICLGISTLLALTGTLDPIKRRSTQAEIDRSGDGSGEATAEPKISAKQAERCPLRRGRAMQIPV